MPLTDNIVTLGWKGTLKKQVVFRQRGGKTVVSGYPDMSNRVLTAKQLRVNETMKRANEYVNIVLRDDKSRDEAQVRLNVPRNRLYNALIKEYYANNYQPLKDSTTPVPEPGTPETPPSPNFDFMKYLLESTEKSVAEIAKMTGMEINFVFYHQKIFRKEKVIDFPSSGDQV